MHQLNGNFTHHGVCLSLYTTFTLCAGQLFKILKFYFNHIYFPCILYVHNRIMIMFPPKTWQPLIDNISAGVYIESLYS